MLLKYLFEGWPSLQVQLLQELVVAAKRMGHSALATRHMTFLLQTMWEHLSSNDQRELSLQLQVIIKVLQNCILCISTFQAFNHGSIYFNKERQKLLPTYMVLLIST